MNTHSPKSKERGALTGVILLLLVIPFVMHGQGTITFNANPTFNGTDYYELGMGFHVVMPSPQPYHDWIVGAPGTYANEPLNPTPYIFFYRQNSPDNYVSFSLTNGSLFILNSVQLADPNAPSYSLLPITFIGFLADGSTVSQTFTTPGGGANSFLTYQFGPDFASGLLSVKIDAPRWAMDNLVYVIPEPSVVSLVLVGSGVFVYVRRRRRKH